MKTCSACKEIKTLNQFTKRKDSKDGLKGRCKVCCNKQCRKSYSIHGDKRREYRRKYIADGRNKAPRERTRKKHRNAFLSRQRFSNATSDGRLIRQSTCQQCQSTTSIQGHHCDYNKPLDVMWLCRSCHTEWHSKFEPLNRTHGIFNPTTGEKK